MRKTVAVDASFLIVLVDKRARGSLENGIEQINRLIERLSSENAKVIIPTPVLADVLTRAPQAAQAYLEQINKCVCFQVRPFDDKAAIELARLLGKSVVDERDILRFDRQIVAIAKVYSATVLYADDEKLAEFAAGSGLQAVRFKDLG